MLAESMDTVVIGIAVDLYDPRMPPGCMFNGGLGMLCPCEELCAMALLK